MNALLPLITQLMLGMLTVNFFLIFLFKVERKEYESIYHEASNLVS